MEMVSGVNTMALQDLSFVLCDTEVQGYPIRFASRGFERLFGYSSSECFGRTCGLVVGSESILQNDLGSIAEVSGLSPEDTASALRVLRGHVSEEVQKMACEKRGFSIMVNQAKAGNFIPCELDLRFLEHPRLGWTYCVGVQSDITSSLSVRDLLRTATRGPVAFGALIAERGGRRDGQALRQLLQSDSISTELNTLAARMWFDSASKLVPKLQDSKPEDKTKVNSKSLASRSTCSGGTASSFGSVASPRSTPTDLATHQGRFLDLVQEVETEVLTDVGDARQESKSLLIRIDSTPATCSSPSGNLDERLRRVVQKVARKELNDLDFPFVLADPSLQNCPLVACSAGFSSLTSYDPSEVIGNGLPFLLQGVPTEQICSQAESAMQGLLDHAARGRLYSPDGRHGVVLDADGKVPPGEDNFPEGELACIQTLASKSGQFFRCFLHMKQVELDDEMFIACLLTPVPAMLPSNPFGLTDLGRNMDLAIEVLASKFWLSSPMRRQMACQNESSLSDLLSDSE